jgi:sugar lactone lactonase YvrE
VSGGFNHPFGLGLDETHGRVLIADTANHRFKWFDVNHTTMTPLISEHGYISNLDHANALNDCQGIAADAAGNVFVVNTLKGRVKAFAWNGGAYALNNTFASANPSIVAGLEISYPRDIAVGPDGAVYLLDSGNNRILKADGIADTTWEVLTTGADWKNPYGLTVSSGNVVFVADTGNHRIIKIPPSGPVTIIGGWGKGSGRFSVSARCRCRQAWSHFRGRHV